MSKTDLYFTYLVWGPIFIIVFILTCIIFIRWGYESLIRFIAHLKALRYRKDIKVISNSKLIYKQDHKAKLKILD